MFGGRPGGAFGGGLGGQQQPTGFGQQQPSSGGFGQQPQQTQQHSLTGQSGFGGQATAGFGQATAGFGQQSAGFGTPAPGGFGGGGLAMTPGMSSQQQLPPYILDKNEVDVPHQFTDSISDIKIKSVPAQQSYYMAVSSWDGKIQVFQINSTVGPAQPPQVSAPMANAQLQGPILGICWQIDSPIMGQQQQPFLFIAHSDGKVYRWDMQNQPQQVGQHTAPCKDVHTFTLNGQFFLASGGWDCMVKFYKIDPQNVQQIGETYVGKPVHYMSGAEGLLVTAHSEKQIHLWNLESILRNSYDPVHVCDSPLKYETSSLCAFSNGKGFTLGSIEGRCGVVNVNFQVDKVTDLDFCFKCHRVESGSTGDAYTVNNISFNKKWGTFSTVGSDGTFIVWNKDSKARYKSSKPAPMPMTNCCFSDDALLLVFASGEDWSKGNEFAKNRQNLVKIYVRRCEDSDVYKPKGR